MQKIKDNLGLIFISVVTILYLWIACNLVINFEEVKALKLNEKGDFLAGIFSPLAFLWLVYGYLQQGQELKQNTEALRLQADELKNSVTQQTEQVRLTAEQLALITQKETLEIDKIIESVKPKFSIWISRYSYDDGYELSIHNYGAKVTDSQVSYSHGSCINATFKLINHSDTGRFIIRDQISLNIPESFLMVTYTNELGYQGEIKFMISNDQSRINNIGFFACSE